MKVGDIVFVFDWARECLCEGGPETTGHTRPKNGSLDTFDIVLHLEAIRKRAEEDREDILWTIEKRPYTIEWLDAIGTNEVRKIISSDEFFDCLVQVEVEPVVVHEALHAATNIEIFFSKAMRARVDKISRAVEGKFFHSEFIASPVEYVINALADWSLFGHILDDSPVLQIGDEKDDSFAGRLIRMLGCSEDRFHIDLLKIVLGRLGLLPHK